MISANFKCSFYFYYNKVRENRLKRSTESEQNGKLLWFLKRKSFPKRKPRVWIGLLFEIICV